MTRASVQEVLKEATRYVELIKKPTAEMTEAEKDQVVEESIPNFNQFVNPGWLEYRKSVSTDATFVEWEDHDSSFTDTHGVEFLDCLGGYGIYACGHRNPEIVSTVVAQLGKMCLHSQELVDPLRGFLAKLVAMITPGDLQYSFFTNGGAEANEMALKLCRLATGNHAIISTVYGFHGKSMGAVSVSGKGTYRKPYIPLVAGVHHVEYGNADALEAMIKNLQAVGDTVAGFIAEPIQGEAGVRIPGEDYWPRVRQICDKYGVVLIADEIQTGMGRTGTWWGVDHWNVVPDVITFGKSFGGGVMPITGIIARPHLWDKMKENPWILGSPTFGGNPACCSAAIATIKYMAEHDIPGQFKDKGDYFTKGLKEIQAKHKVLMDVRGRGLLIGLEYPADHIGYEISAGMFANKILVGGTLNNARVFRIEPPAIITYEEIDRVLATLDKVIGEVEAKHAADIPGLVAEFNATRKEVL
jgi:putrescine aminotransferase